MKILLCAATEREIQPTMIWLASTQNSSVDVLLTGVGLLAATYSLTKAVAAKRPGIMIQAGIGGSFDEKEWLGKVVAVQREVVADLGVEESGFRSLFDLKLLDAHAHPYKNGKLVNENDLLHACGLPLVDGITVNEISTAKERVKHYRTMLNASVESMEGAALHYVGLREAVPFLQLRSLSNFVGERDKTKWKVQEAIAALNIELQRLLKNLTA